MSTRNTLTVLGAAFAVLAVWLFGRCTTSAPALSREVSHAAGALRQNEGIEMLVQPGRPLRREEIDGIQGIVVVDPLGRRLPGVEVFAIRRGDRVVAEDRRLGETDEDGTAHLAPGWGQDGEKLHFVGRGYLPMTLEELPAHGILRLQPASLVTARAVTPEGQPVPGLTMRLSMEFMGSGQAETDLRPGEMPSAVHSATSQEDGRLAITTCGTGMHRVWFEHPDRIVVHIDGADHLDRVSTPLPELRIVCVEPAAVWVRFEPGSALSLAYTHSSKVWRSRGLREQIERFRAERSWPDARSGATREFLYLIAPNVPVTDLPTFRLIGLLSSGEATAIDLQWTRASELEAKVVHVPDDRSRIGRARCVVKDSRGKSIPVLVQLTGAGTAMYVDPEVEPSALAWGALVRSGEPIEMLAGSYSAQVSGNWLRRRIPRASLSVVAGSEVKVETQADTPLVAVDITVDDMPAWQDCPASLCLRSEGELDYLRSRNHRIGKTQTWVVPPGYYRMLVSVDGRILHEEYVLLEWTADEHPQSITLRPKG